MKQIKIGSRSFNILTVAEIAKLTNQRLYQYLRTARSYRGLFVYHCATCYGPCVRPEPVGRDERIPALDWAVAAADREKQRRK
ncbi:MAG: hypothetical protein UY48_C0006G0043 [Candidatus Gottesmanbacteria bacterium GW2011_GWB1_49_7]|uniref:Uncharacterized protein n=1 Tax=Candidatus Gottesmanbacteria bacterium GW2011_GWB1_49_7 TaxID=1618448 RepID=A0A0G1W318_9BACT|nr:MAG: hypothetical protein UY48_C0006G0043 [Candidatus Gottesmanbacteria bacterium GW2011_GWB1_49_7]